MNQFNQLGYFLVIFHPFCCRQYSSWSSLYRYTCMLFNLTLVHFFGPIFGRFSNPIELLPPRRTSATATSSSPTSTRPPRPPPTSSSLSSWRSAAPRTKTSTTGRSSRTLFRFSFYRFILLLMHGLKQGLHGQSDLTGQISVTGHKPVIDRSWPVRLKARSWSKSGEKLGDDFWACHVFWYRWSWNDQGELLFLL